MISINSNFNDKAKKDDSNNIENFETVNIK